MKVFVFGEQEKLNEIPENLPETGLFAVCHAGEIQSISERFGWDKSTTTECLNLDETTRYSSYDGYDFISLIHMEMSGDTVVQREINLFFSKQYLVLVLPEQISNRLVGLEAVLCRAAEKTDLKPGRIFRLYYLVFSRLATDISDALERLEDKLEDLAEAVSQSAQQNQIDEIGRLRKTAYTTKKILRALSYIGGDILIDENGLLKKSQISRFRAINTRFKKLYDFAVSLYELSGAILNVYDSKLSIKMNESVNKLTVITLFFGPLTVITGVYGMNFKNMPELEWIAGYPLALCLMVFVCLTIYLILKKKKWI